MNFAEVIMVAIACMVIGCLAGFDIGRLTEWRAESKRVATLGSKKRRRSRQTSQSRPLPGFLDLTNPE